MSENKGFVERLNLVIQEQFGGKPNRLAIASRISPGTFSRYIEGKSVPGGENLIRIKEATGKSIDWLLTGKEKEAPPHAAEETAHYSAMTPEEREYLKKLLDVLRNPATKKAIQENIDTFLKVPWPEVPLEEEDKKGGMAS